MSNNRFFLFSLSRVWVALGGGYRVKDDASSANERGSVVVLESKEVQNVSNVSASVRVRLAAGAVPAQGERYLNAIRSAKELS